MDTVSVTLLDDETRTRGTVVATYQLAELISYAHQWALEEKRGDPCTLSFSSMLAAMTSGSDPLCGWLRSHLALRGVRAESMTKGRRFGANPLPDVLTTTRSFRLALAKARELCANEEAHGLAVRHLMAAYAVIPAYHLSDFLRLNIDRRAWCIELAEHLASRFPDERDVWLTYGQEATPVPSLGFNTDAPEGRDLLNVDREVEAFARLIASRNTATPLSVGVFGAWGSGKSFFMHRLRRRVGRFAALGREEGPTSKYHGWIAQIDFNAWHYSEGNLAASFVDHILRNLRVGSDETAATLKERSEIIIRQLDSATQDLVMREKAVADAEADSARTRQAVAELDGKIAGEMEAKNAEIATARRGIQEAQEKLAKELEALQREIDEEVKRAPAIAVASLLLKRLSGAEVTSASTSVKDLIAEVQAASARRELILYGLVVVAIGAAATALMETNIYAKVIAAVTAVSGLAATAATWLRKLNALAQSGKELEDQQSRIRQTTIDEVTSAHEELLSGLRAVATERLAIVASLAEQLKHLEQAPATARLALEAFEKQRADALMQQAQAAAVVEDKKAELAKLTAGTLLDEFLDERTSNDGYLKQLTIFSRVRNDFERLSDLMTKANAEYVKGSGTSGQAVRPPTVSRIVLYIDDLDRCPADRVVEVLKLIHLLLAFPLFVCVAAVDPRWITRCLHQAPGLIDVGGESELDAEFGDRATASDYLEKIFQIPLWLRPVPSEQRSAIARTLLDSAESTAEPGFELPIMGSRSALATSLATADDVEGAVEAQGLQSVDPDIISGEELDYLDQLAGLLGGNPRSLKRFVNTYRLVKTALSDVELAVFVQPFGIGRGGLSPYRICMAQLAVLCTQRTRALNLVQHVDKAKGDTKLNEWLTQFAESDEDLGRCLRDALGPDLGDADIRPFRRWLERTRRYSFYL